MALVEKGQCLITHLDEHGCGIGKTAVGLVKLPYTLPNEIVEFERHTYRQVTNFILKNVIRSSPDRVEPICQYFSACGGCSLQHLNIIDYNNFKINNLNIALARLVETSTVVQPLISIGPQQRRRANLTAIKKDDNIYLGFKRFHAHQIINIAHCPALSPSLSKILVPLKLLLNIILDNKQKIQIYLTAADNGLDLLIEGSCNANIAELHYDTISEFTKEFSVISFNINNQNSKILSLVHAIPVVKFGDFNVEVDAKSFLQATLQSDKILSKIIIDLLGLKSQQYNYRIIDLFCGRGTFTLPLTNYVDYIEGIEGDINAVEALNKAIKVNKINNIKALSQDLFTTPIRHNYLNNFDYCIINPPRAGGKQQCYELSKTNLAKIIYVSCNLASFIQDAKILINSGFRLTSITPVDQFYWNTHLEIVALFVKL